METDYVLRLEKIKNPIVWFRLGIFGSIIQSLKESFEAVVRNKGWHEEEDVIACGFPKLSPLSCALFWAAVHAGLPSNTITPS